MSLSHFQSEFEKLMNRDYFSDKIHALRAEAFSKFLNTGIPTQKWEDWRFTNLTRIAKGEYRISETQDGPNGKIDEKFSLVPVGETLSDILEIPIKFSHDCISEDAINVTIGLHPGEVHLLENLRFTLEKLTMILSLQENSPGMGKFT